MNRPFVKPLVILAFLFTTLNAFKPLCIDDTLYYYHAQHLAAHPLHPYGFRVFQNDRPEPAVQALAPVMMPYWWAIAIRLFGQQPFLWKLWLLPYALLLVFSLHALLRRFARGQEVIVTWMIVMSPVFLPSFNLMLDVPVAALALSAIALFLEAADRDSLGLALAAGLVAGVASQTKYNGMVAAAVILLYGLIERKLRLAIVAAVAAALFFVGWEGFIVWAAGRSHFLVQAQIFGSVHLGAKYRYLAWPIVSIVGAVAPVFAIFALVALRASRRAMAVYSGAVFLGFLLLTFVPGRLQVLGGAPTGGERVTFGTVLFRVYGIAFAALLAAVFWRLTRWKGGLSGAARFWRKRKVEWFLTGWLVIEIVAYFGLSPIPAVRRVLGLLVVSTLLIGRLASRTCRSPERKALVRQVAFAGMLLGLLFFAVDFRDANVERIAVAATARQIKEMGPPKDTWYFARWGFQYYAEHAGMKPVLPDESDFHAGDWLVVSDEPHFPQPVAEHIKRYRLEPMAELVFEDRLPLATMLGFYSTGIPIHHQDGPRRKVNIYRITGSVSGDSAR